MPILHTNLVQILLRPNLRLFIPNVFETESETFLRPFFSRPKCHTLVSTESEVKWMVEEKKQIRCCDGFDWGDGVMMLAI